MRSVAVELYSGQTAPLLLMRYLVILAHHPLLVRRSHWFFIPITLEGQLAMADRADAFIFNRRLTPWDPIAGISYDTEVIVCEYINGGWQALGPARRRGIQIEFYSLNLDLTIDPEEHEGLVVEPSEEDEAKLESSRQPAQFKIYAPLDYDPSDGDKGLYVRWDTPAGAYSIDMYVQAYDDWSLRDYWDVTGGFPQSGPRYFERWS